MHVKLVVTLMHLQLPIVRYVNNMEFLLILVVPCQASYLKHYQLSLQILGQVTNSIHPLSLQQYSHQCVIELLIELSHYPHSSQRRKTITNAVCYFIAKGMHLFQTGFRHL